MIAWLYQSFFYCGAAYMHEQALGGATSPFKQTVDPMLHAERLLFTGVFGRSAARSHGGVAVQPYCV